MNKQNKYHDKFLGDFKWYENRKEWRGSGRKFAGQKADIVIDVASQEQANDPRLFRDAARLFPMLEKNERMLRWQTVLSEMDGDDYLDFGDGPISPLCLWANLRPNIVRFGRVVSIYYKSKIQLDSHYLIGNINLSGKFLGSEMEG